MTTPDRAFQVSKTSLFRLQGHIILTVAIVGLTSPDTQAIEPYLGYYDEVPPIDQSELDAIQERTREARKRLQRPDIAAAEKAAEREPIDPLPPPVRDERDGVPAVDFREVDELRKAFEEMQGLERKSDVPTAPSNTPSESTPSPPPTTGKKDLDQEVQALTQRVDALERVLVGTEERPGLSGLIGGWTRHNGFFLMSSGGDFFLRIPGLIQADFRSFPAGQDGTDPGVHPSTFILQRMRPMVHVRLWRYFRGLLTPDFGNGMTQNTPAQGQVQVPDGFIEWDYFSQFRIRVGKFKSPIGLEMLQATQNLSFMERSLTRNLLANRDLGLMVWGVFDHGLVEYQLGVFNGAPNANFYQEGRAFSSGKTLEARLFTRPFLSSPMAALRGFGFGAGFSWGSVRNNNGQDPMQTETFSYTFFQYLPQVTGDGDRTRIAPQVAWYYQRFGLMGQYVLSSQHLLQQDTGVATRLTHDSWSAQASFFLTNDTATFGHVEPRSPIEPSKGQWGAWEIAVRYAQLNIDGSTFPLGFADPTVNVIRAKSTTVGLNWYLNSNVRITSNYVHSDFTGASPAYRAASHEDSLMFRAQLVF